MTLTLLKNTGTAIELGSLDITLILVDQIHFFIYLSIMGLLKVPQSEVDYVSEHIVNMNNGSEYQDYFEYARRSLGINLPSDWQEADQLYRKLIAVAENGI